jgi:NAD-dependent dihydropyrimidine dehydrogenase PreA subunit
MIFKKEYNEARNNENKNIENDGKEGKNGRLIIDRYKCAYCGACIAVCKYDANLLIETFVEIDEDKCTLCKACVRTCPMNAIEVIDG